MTKLFAIAGDPIAQVRSPEVFNKRFQEQGVDAVMVPLHITSDGLRTVLTGLLSIKSFAGLVITIPHKAAAAGLLSAKSQRVEITGVANALRPSESGWEGDLFDGEGFALGLEATGMVLRERHCSLVGAGGAGAAVALALLDRGIASLSLSDVQPGKAGALAERLRSVGYQCVRLADPGDDTDIAVNATPLGMNANDPLPFDVLQLKQDAIVADVVMKPARTRLLVEAQGRGLRTHEGRHMLDCQVSMIWKFFGLP
jgi:shikimate dehydrogenase